MRSGSFTPSALPASGSSAPAEAGTPPFATIDDRCTPVQARTQSKYPDFHSYMNGTAINTKNTKHTKRIQIEIRMLAGYEVSMFRA